MNIDIILKNTRVTRKIKEAQELLQAVSILNMAIKSGDKVDRILVEQVVKKSYVDASPIMQLFVNREVIRIVNRIEMILSFK